MGDFGHNPLMRRHCSKCNAVMKYMAMGEYKCPECGNEELDDYGKVRRYLDEHGSTPAAIIESETGVRRTVINDYLRHGRLEISDGSPIFLKCEICGKDIKFGRVCAACAKNAVTRQKDPYSVEEIGEEPSEQIRSLASGTMFTRSKKD